MRLLIRISIVGLILYMVALPACQHLALRGVTTDVEEGRFDNAWMRLLPMFEEKPALFLDRVKTLCGQITVQHARTLATQPEPDFGEANRLLLSQEERCRGYVDPQTQSLLEKVAALHLAYGTRLCKQKEHDKGLREFQNITTLAYPERFHREASQEEAWCCLALAKDMTARGWFEEALQELGRAMDSGNVTVRRAALRQVPLVVKKEVVFWIDRGQYIQAFDVFNQRWQHFGQEPEIAHFFPQLESLMQMQVFGMVLSQPCLGKPKKSKGQRPMPVVAISEHPSGLAKTNLTVHNNTGYDLQVLLRGPEEDALQLKPKEKQPLWLEPGRYLVGMFAPGQCRVQPKQTVWTVEPFVYQTIEVVMQGES